MGEETECLQKAGHSTVTVYYWNGQVVGEILPRCSATPYLSPLRFWRCYGRIVERHPISFAPDREKAVGSTYLCG